jgi:mannose-6-phosphate isomerase-like protein (cupin superfamily)
MILEKRRVSVAEAMAKLPRPNGDRYVTVLEHGTLDIEIYAPRGHDPQKPHTRDEVYFVVQGRGEFRNGGKLERFCPGDVLFVPALEDHRFESFTQDLVVWVMFYGPEGGEAAMGAAP